MKQNKFLVIVYDKNTGEQIGDVKAFKSYKDIANAYNLEYHQVRELHLHQSEKHKKKFLHSTLQALGKQIKIMNVEPEISI